MIYKIYFNPPVEFDDILHSVDIADINTNEYSGLTTVKYLESEIILVLGESSNIQGLEIANECTRTWDIENKLLMLSLDLIGEKVIDVELFDSNGFSETLTGADIRENYLDQ